MKLSAVVATMALTMSFGAAQAFDLSTDVKAGYFSAKTSYDATGLKEKVQGIVTQAEITAGHTFQNGLRPTLTAGLLKAISPDGKISEASGNSDFTNTNVTGYKLEGKLGYVVKIEKNAVTPYIGVGVSSTKTEFDVNFHGYRISTEDKLKTRYIKAGIDGEHQISDSLTVYAKAAVIAPFRAKMYQDNTMNDSKSSVSGDTDKKLNYEAELGASFANNIHVGIFCEWEYYGDFTSDTTGITSSESTSYRTVGIKTGVSF